MGDLLAASHVGQYANDLNSEMRKVFFVRENQQDGLGYNSEVLSRQEWPF